MLGEIVRKWGGFTLEIQFALRDEKINVFAMSYGKIPFKHSHQIILCKKSPIPENRTGPFLLYAKRSGPDYRLSEIGVNYLNIISSKNFSLNFIAYVDCQLKVRIIPELFKKLYEEGFFSIWHPEAPCKYFDVLKEGYLVIFRVYQIRDIISDQLLEKGRGGRNYYFNLSQSVFSPVVAPVIKDTDFDRLKAELVSLLKINGWLLEVVDSNYEIPIVKKYSEQDLIKEEKEAYIRNKNLSLSELATKIKTKGIHRRQIIVESKQY